MYWFHIVVAITPISSFLWPLNFFGLFYYTYYTED